MILNNDKDVRIILENEKDGFYQNEKSQKLYNVLFSNKKQIITIKNLLN